MDKVSDEVKSYKEKDTESAQVRSVHEQGAWAQRIHSIERFLGIEAQGVTRVLEAQRDHKAKAWQAAEVWLSANTVLPTFSIGILGPGLFGLGLHESIIVIVFLNLIASLPAAYFSTFGVKTGLRQMVVSRYMWGWWGSKVVALLNVIACIGWSTINCIAGAQTLRVVADLHLSHAVGIVVIAVVTLFLGVVGYRQVHLYDRVAWMPVAVVFLIFLGLTAKDYVGSENGTGLTHTGNVLSFCSTIWGFGLGWSSLASDYVVYLPADTPPLSVFLWAYAGLSIPLVLVMSLGAAVMNAAVYNPAVANWNAEYMSEELGGLVGAALEQHTKVGFAKFLMVVLVLSVIANNIINVYSFGFSLASVTPIFNRVPQFLFPLLITAIYIPLAIVGATSFVTSLESFMNVLGAWLSIYITVFCLEHWIFRKNNFANYDLDGYNDPKRIPMGLAAVAAGCCGAVGAITGLAQVWWTGPIAAKIGMFGGDLSWLLCVGFTAVPFVPLRYLELKFVGR